MSFRSSFVCPKCRGLLTVTDKQYRCDRGHSYDMSSDGYVNLLLANMKNSKQPGDDREMVNSRNMFLNRGYYAALKEKLVEIVKGYSKDGCRLMDIGCGEGYYTCGFAETEGLSVSGIDISKNAVIKAGRRCKGRNNTELAVASAFDIPVGDESVNITVNIFAPLCLDEIRRILKHDGIFIYVIPGEKHLWTMKKVIYDNPYMNEVHIDEYEGFSFVKEYAVEKDITVEGEEMIKSLIDMTPYSWHTPRSLLNRLKGIDRLETEISFRILVYSRI